MTETIRWLAGVVVAALATFGFYHYKNADVTKMDICLKVPNLVYKEGGCVRESKLEIITPETPAKK